MEKEYNGLSGYVLVLAELIIVVLVIFGMMRGMFIPSAFLIFLFLLIAPGFT